MGSDMAIDTASEIILLRDVSVSFDGKMALENVNMSVDKGDFIAISGPNGGGKTTLLRVLLKLLKPTAGSVEYYDNGRVVKHLPIGYLPQKSKIDTHFPITVRDTVMSGLQRGWRGGLPGGSEGKFRDVVELCGIGGYLDKGIGELSGGQLQRTLLGRAVISDPKVLVLDEPLSYVDKQFEYKIYSIMEELKSRATILLVSHEMTVISEMANRHITVDHNLLIHNS